MANGLKIFTQGGKSKYQNQIQSISINLCLKYELEIVKKKQTKPWLIVNMLPMRNSSIKVEHTSGGTDQHGVDKLTRPHTFISSLPAHVSYKHLRTEFMFLQSG